MIVGFSKLFSDIIHSTVWREEMHVKVVWVTMLAMADRHGQVMASVPGLADAAKVTLEQCLDALQKFQSPDEYSRTKDYDGRRIMEVDGGWLLFNYEKFRDRKDDEEQRIKTRERVRKFREKAKGVTENVTVTPSNDIQKQIQTAEAEKEKNAASPRIIRTPPPEASYSPPILKPKDRELVFIDWLDAIAKAMGAKNRFGLTRKDKWKEVILTCMNEGYQPSELTVVIDATLSDPKFEMKYFSPEKTLDELRLQKRPKANSSKLQSAADKLAADEADRQNIIRPPVQRVS